MLLTAVYYWSWQTPTAPSERAFPAQTNPPPTPPSSDSQFATLRADLECDAQDLEAESWSLAVDQEHLKKLCKSAVKRQDVIYGERARVCSFSLMLDHSLPAAVFSPFISLYP